MRYSHRPLPYFDALLRLVDDHPQLAQSFGRHVHWGYWEHPPANKPDGAEFAEAAERLTRVVCDAAGIGDGHCVLDVGCGFGGTVASLNERFDRLTLRGLNIEHRQLERAKRLSLNRASNRVHWIHANACELPFADASLDAILAVECIFHFPSRQDFFREAYRVLKPGGRLALSDFLTTRPLRPVAWLMSRIPTSAGFYGDCDVQFGYRDYRALAQVTGFAMRVEQDITRNTLPTYDYLQDLSANVPFDSPVAGVQTLFIAAISRWGLLRYAVLGFEKPPSSPER